MIENIIPVTVIVPVKNEARIIRNCLNKLKYFEQVIVVDSNSIDGTKDIVELEYLYEYYNFNWNGYYPKKRNWVLENIEIRNDYVLFLDADEILTNEFINEITNKIQTSDYSGYWLIYENYFLDKKLNYGVKMKKLALFNRHHGCYEKIDDQNWSKFDMEIHEHPIINGSIGTINSQIIHNDFKGIDSFINKHNEYATWEAKRFLALGKNLNLTFRQKVKYYFMSSLILSIIYFIYNYLFKLGFLDGRRGLIYSSLKSFYFLLIYIKIYELKYKPKLV